MRERMRLFTGGVWIGRRPSGGHVTARVDGLNCHLEQLLDVPGGIEFAEERNQTWDEFVGTWRFHAVHDYVNPGSLGRLATLFPLLEPGGVYELAASEGKAGDKQPDSIEALCCKLERYFSAYLRRFVVDFSVDGRILRLVKSSFSQWSGVGVTIPELESGIRRSLYETSYDRVPARIYGSDYHSRLLERNSGGFQPQRVPGQHWLELSNVTVEGYGQVHPSDNSVLVESFSHLRNSKKGLLHSAYNTHFFVSELPLVPKAVIGIDKPCILLKQPWDSNYGHWMIDNFARLAGSRDLDLTKFNFVLSKVSNPGMRKVFCDSLSLLGVATDQIIELDMNPVLIEHALYPEPISRAPFVKHPASIEFLESLVEIATDRGGVNRAPGGRVYISRNKGSRRRLLNEEAVVKFVETAGYTVIAPEEFSLYDQIVTFGAASHIIGNMGAAMTNVAFSPGGVKLACIANTVMPHDYFYDIVCHKSGSYVGIQGIGATAIGDDFEVDLDLLFKVLKVHDFVG